MRHIWDEGFEIERDGQKITINPQEIALISNLIDAWKGRGSIEYWLDCIDEDTDETLVQAAKKAMEDENICFDVWNDFEEDCFYNSGEIEYEVVEDTLRRYIEKEGE